MYTIVKLTFVLAVSATIFAGCYPKGREYYSDSDLTVTDYDIEYDFGGQKKYFMADTVEYITNIIDNEIDPDDVDDLLQEVESNFTSRKYTRLDADEIDDAEFVVTVSVIVSKNLGVGYIPGPPYYPGWGWGGGWGGYYPPYWGNYYSYNYTTGSVIIQWWDPQEDPASAEEQPIHWISTFNGLVSSSKSDNKSRIATSIQQAFKQSPYILSDN